MAHTPGVMFIVPSLADGPGTGLLVDLVEGLAQGGRYQPVVGCLGRRTDIADRFTRQGIRVHDRLLGHGRDVRIFRRVRDRVAAEHIRIVVIVGSRGEAAFWGVLAAAAAGAKTVLWSHEFSQVGHPAFDLRSRLLYPLVDRFVALGRRHGRNLVWFDKVPEGRIRVIPYGVQVSRFDHPAWRDRARSTLGLADDDVTAVGLIGDLVPEKRQDLFIRAAAQVVRHRRDVHFFIIGDGPDRQIVQRWARESELSGAYLSLLGHRADLAQLLPGLDVACVTSEYNECLNLAALEAMAAGVLVVSHAIGSMDEIITPGRTGFFFRPLTASALAECLLEIIPDRLQREAVARAAYENIRTHFTLEQMIQRFTALFDDVTARHPLAHL